MITKENTLAYLAGAIDGDGSFSILKSKSPKSKSPLYYPCIQLANAKHQLIDLLQEKLGGNKGIRSPYISKDGVKKITSYYWKLEKSAKCFPVLDNLIPYLIIKKERASYLRNFIIENPAIKTGGKILDRSILMRREKAYLKMMSLNYNPAVNCELLSKNKRINSDDDIFWSYIGGLMDTDGSFSLKKENRKSGGSKSAVYTPTILITMTDCRAIYHIMNNFSGGNLMVVKAKTATNGFCYRFSITSRKNAISFLNKCVPFLLLKKDVATKLLEYCENVPTLSGSVRISEEQSSYRDNYYCLIKELNNGVYKSSLIDLKPLPGNAEGNKAEGNTTVNVVSENTMKVDAVL